MMTQLAPGAPWPGYVFRPQPEDAYTPPPPPPPPIVAKPVKTGVTAETLAYLDENPGSYATHISEELGRGYAAVGDALQRLKTQGRVRSAMGDEYSKGGFLMLRWWRIEQ